MGLYCTYNNLCFHFPGHSKQELLSSFRIVADAMTKHFTPWPGVRDFLHCLLTFSYTLLRCYLFKRRTNQVKFEGDVAELGSILVLLGDEARS